MKIFAILLPLIVGLTAATTTMTTATTTMTTEATTMTTATVMSTALGPAPQRLSATHQVQIVEAHPRTPHGYTSSGIVRRQNRGKNIQTLIEIQLLGSMRARMCTLEFSGGKSLSGTKQIRLYTISGPISSNNTYWDRPHRDQYVGMFKATAGDAIWSETNGRTFSCSSHTPKSFYYEVVPVGDNDGVHWDLPNGLQMIVQRY